MGRVAYLFPGQGSQEVGMGLPFAAVSPASARVFEAANDALRFDIRGLIESGPASTLGQTEHTQPALLTASIAALQAARENGLPAPDFVAGHSLGEYSALVAADALSLEDAVRLVRARGQFMQEAVPVGQGSMAAVLMLEPAQVEEACSAIQTELPGRVVVPANINGRDQVVISGHADAVRAASQRCLDRGARRVVPLDVSAPFHSPLMLPAQRRLAEQFAPTLIRDASVPLVSNVEAHPTREAGRLRALLIVQVAAAVQWTAVVDRLVEEGCDTFFEFGPGTVLSGLVRRQARHVRTFSISDPERLTAARQALAA